MLYLDKRKNMGLNARLEEKASILGRQGSHDQSGGSIYSSLFYECF